MGSLFNLIIVIEIVIALALILVSFRTLRGHWRTTLAGAFVIVAALLVNGIYLVRAGGFYDTIGFAQTLAVGIAFLLAADSHAA